MNMQNLPTEDYFCLVILQVKFTIVDILLFINSHLVIYIFELCVAVY